MKQLLPAKIANKVAVIPEGVNIQKFSFLDKATCRERLKWSADEKVILFFNNGSFVKNLPLAQQSLDLVKKQYPETRLLQISSVPNSELIYYYNAADLLLITSFHEGSNNSIKEALACNCPVVATNVGDADERLKDASPSFCVNSYHPEEIAASIELILKDGKRSNGRKRVEEVSVENVSKKLADFIKQIVGRK